MTHRLSTNYAKNYCNRTRIVKVIVENVVTCFWGHSVVLVSNKSEVAPQALKKNQLNEHQKRCMCLLRGADGHRKLTEIVQT